MKLKSMTCWFTHSAIPALALFVALGALTTGIPVIAKDNEDKDKNRETQSTLQGRERELRGDERDDVNAKTDPEKFISHVAQSGAKEIRLANLAKQRAQSEEVKQFAEKLVQDHTKANKELKLIAQHQNILWDIQAEKTRAAANGTARGAGSTDSSPAITSIEKETIRSADTTPGETTGTARGAAVLRSSGSVISSSVDPASDRETPAAVDGTARGAYAANAQGRNVSADQDEDTYNHVAGLTGKSFDEAYMNHEVGCHIKAVAKFEKASRDLPDGELKQFVQSTLPTLREHLAMAQRLAPADTTRPNIRERTDRDSNRKEVPDQSNK
jgi:predicted outer membrane protein